MAQWRKTRELAAETKRLATARQQLLMANDLATQRRTVIDTAVTIITEEAPARLAELGSPIP